MLIETHCHIHDPEYHYNIPEILKRAKYNNIQKIIVIGTSPRNNKIAQIFANNHKEIYWTLGHHPGEPSTSEADSADAFLERLSPSQTATYIPDAPDKVAVGEARLQSLPESQRMTPPAEMGLSKNVSAGAAPTKLVAIGEIGLDYHYPGFNRKQQIKRLETMLELAKKLDLPIVFHIREAFPDFWPIIDNAKIQKAVLHSFSDTQQNLNQAIKRNLKIGINGLATFTDIPLPPLENLILETDAPYLTPTPFRGKINEPSYIKNIAEWVAEKYQVPFEKVANQTTQNATQLFNL